MLLRENPSSLPAWLAATALLLVAAGACSGKAVPEATPAPPPQIPAETGAEQPSGAAAEELDEPGRDPAPPADRDLPLPDQAASADAEDRPVDEPVPSARDQDLVVLEAGGVDPEDGSKSLVEAARAERARRSQAPEPTIVITDKNLADYASGDLTIAEATPAGGGEETGVGDATVEEAAESAADRVAGESRDEDYWRSRALEIRLDWRAAAERIAELEARVSELRTRFYAEDDGFYRDSQIKPAWDRAIDQLRQTRADAERHQQELEAFLEEGRRAGALPGWLREGIDYEPEPLAEPSAIHEPGEPPVAEEPEGGG